MANEIAETVQSYDQEVLDRTEPQEESTKTSVDVVSSEDVQVITEAGVHLKGLYNFNDIFSFFHI